MASPLPLLRIDEGGLSEESVSAACLKDKRIASLIMSNEGKEIELSGK
jgi:hypothetical protein